MKGMKDNVAIITVQDERNTDIFGEPVKVLKSVYRGKSLPLGKITSIMSMSGKK
jgi:hypothetical protein